MKTKNKFGRKGIISGILGPYVVAAFLIAAILIFMYQFKFCMAQMMVDYFLWGKEFNIPMALFKTDIKGENSALAFSRLIHKTGNYIETKNELNKIVDEWFVPYSKYYEYTLQMGDIFISKQGGCTCGVACARGICVGKCLGSGCGGKEGGSCSNLNDCMDQTKIIKRENVGAYPLPVTYNGTIRIVPMVFSTTVWVELG